MYGWRGRFGHVSPGLHDTQGLEFDRLLPEGVIVVTTTMTVQSLAVAEFEQSFSMMEERALALSREEVGAIVIGGAPIFCLKGIGSHQKIIDAVYTKTGIPTTTTISAAMDALKRLNVKRLAVATPLLQKKMRTCRYLDGSGFEVLVIKGLGMLKERGLTN
jgi:maleate isomerase